MVSDYGKVWNLGHKAILELFMDEVVVEEKIDGSQFSMAVKDGILSCRSHKQQIDFDYPNKMFGLAIKTALDLHNDSLLKEGYTYRCEYLAKPKHNTLAYNRIPKKNLILFDIDRGLQNYLSYDEKVAEANLLGLEVVPLLFKGKIVSQDMFKKLLETDSILCGQKVEGIVIKNYARFGIDGKCLMGKFVSEKFKEIHRGSWAARNPTQGNVIQKLGESLKTEARWIKAVQNLKETGEYKGDVADIGNLFKRVNKDIIEECSGQIKDVLFKAFWPKISKIVTSGLPQWYKDELLKEMKYEV